MIEKFKLSERAKTQLITLKRKTKIENWNILCRWAFCLSLKEPSVPPHESIPSDSSVEMTWKVFGGEHAEVYHAMLLQRCKQDGIGLKPEKINAHFRLHLHRGISYLASDKSIKSISTFVEKAWAK